MKNRTNGMLLGPTATVNLPRSLLHLVPICPVFPWSLRGKIPHLSYLHLGGDGFICMSISDGRFYFILYYWTTWTAQLKHEWINLNLNCHSLGSKYITPWDTNGFSPLSSPEQDSFLALVYGRRMEIWSIYHFQFLCLKANGGI